MIEPDEGKAVDVIYVDFAKAFYKVPRSTVDWQQIYDDTWITSKESSKGTVIFSMAICVVDALQH